MTEPTIYLDHAAATPLDPKVLEAMRPYLVEEFYNPSSLYQSAKQTRLAVEYARAKVANVLGAKKPEIIWTAGGTESVNLAIFGVLRAISMSSPGLTRASSENRPKFVTTAIEHEAVLACLPELEREGYQTTVVPVKSDGMVAVEAIERAIDDNTALVSVMYANNEIGTIQPLAEISKSIAKVRADRQKRGINLPLYLHTDACQAGGLLDLHVSRLEVDLMTLNGSKIYGPKQTGCLYVRSGVKISPMIWGGGQERGLRSGTENVAGLIGLAAALELVQSRRESETRRLTELRQDCLQRLEAAIPDLILNGHSTKRLANNLNITIPGIDGEAAVLYLDRAGIMASTGSACSTGNTDPSHVLLALGRSRDQASGSLRFTLGRSTTSAEIDRLIGAIPGVVTRLRELAQTS